MLVLEIKMQMTFILLKEWKNLFIDFNLVGTEGGEINQHDIDNDESKIDIGWWFHLENLK